MGRKKKAADASQLSQLALLRIQRNWTQEDLAEQVGASPISISRWERGSSMPGLRFRKKLQELLHIHEGDVNWRTQAKPEKPEEEAPGTSNSPSVASTTTMLPVISTERKPYLLDPTLPHPSTTPLVGREEFIQDLVLQLCAGTGSLALTGLPGVGKTAVAVALAYHPLIQQKFQDGILWIGLGCRPHAVAGLNRWGKLISPDTTEINTLLSVDDWARFIHERIAHRRMLLLIDDAWEACEAFSFRVGGAQCMHVLTTRFPAIAAAFAPGHVRHVPELQFDESRNLLHQLVPLLRDIDARGVKDLITLVGGLPLALTLVGRYLQLQGHSGQQRRLQGALTRLCQNMEERLNLAMPQLPWENGNNWPVGARLSLQTTIELSDNYLPEQARSALYALSVLPARPAYFSEGAALTVGDITEETLDLLVDCGLVEHDSQRNLYQLHQTIADYARVQRKDSDAEVRLVQYALRELSATNGTGADFRELELATFMQAMETALKQRLWAEAVRGCLSFIPLLIDNRLYAMADTLFPQAFQAAEDLHDQDALVQLWLLKGDQAEQICYLAQATEFFLTALALAEKGQSTELKGKAQAKVGCILSYQGLYASSEPYLKVGLELLREGQDWKYLCTVYRHLGETASGQGRLQQAQEWYMRGLEIAQREEQWLLASPILQNLGVLTSRQGEIAQALAFYQLGLEYARRDQDLLRESAILMNLGMMAYQQQEMDNAIEFTQQSLELARRMENNLRISSNLQNLGLFACARGEVELAEQYLKESLELAYLTGHQWLIYETEGVWGQCLVLQGRLAEAEQKFQYMLVGVEKIEAPLLQAMALYGLAQVAAKRKEQASAVLLATRSLAILDELNDVEGQEVRSFLASLV